MKEYFISEINIEKLYHLSNITIELDTTKRQHLLLTGKNGSGKTSLLLRLVRYLKVLKAADLNVITPVLIGNTADYSEIKILKEGDVSAGDEILSLA